MFVLSVEIIFSYYFYMQIYELNKNRNTRANIYTVYMYVCMRATQSSTVVQFLLEHSISSFFLTYVPFSLLFTISPFFESRNRCSTLLTSINPHIRAILRNAVGFLLSFQEKTQTHKKDYLFLGPNLDIVGR
jgi:hypothetical protein